MFCYKKNFRICKIDAVFGTITKSDCTAVERGITVNNHYNILWCMLLMNGENLFENDISKEFNIWNGANQILKIITLILECITVCHFFLLQYFYF